MTHHANHASAVICSHQHEKKKRFLLRNQLNRQDPTLKASYKLIALLHDESDEKNTGEHKQCNDLARIPGIQCASKVDCHDAAEQSRHGEKSTQIVVDLELLHDAHAGARLERRHDEDVDGGEGCEDNEIDVETPTPGSVCGEGTADEWTDDLCKASQSCYVYSEGAQTYASQTV